MHAGGHSEKCHQSRELWFIYFWFLGCEAMYSATRQ